MNIFLSPSEIDLVCYTQEQLIDTDIVITSNTKKAFLDNKSKPIITYLTCIIPSLLKSAYGIPYNKSLEKKIIGTKTQYDKVLENFLEGLKNIGIDNQLELIRRELSYSKFPFGPRAWDKLTQLIYKNRIKIKKELSLDGWNYLKAIYTIMASDESLDEENLTFLKKEANLIPDKLLAKFIGSIETDIEKDDASVVLLNARKSEDEVTKKYFKTSEPTAEQLKEFQTKFPEKYKEYRKIVLASKKAAKQVIEEEFRKKGYSVIDVKIARSILKSYSIPDPIDKNFIGKVGLGSTASSLFSFYTSSGKLLDSVVRKNVIMNPKYSDSNDTYYCTHIPFISKEGKPVKVYTAEHWKQSHEKLYNGLRESLNVLEDVRQTFATDVKPILNDKFTVKAIAALVCKVIDETAGRIGNAGSENKMNTYGIHNLTIKHTRKTKTGYILRYIGKKGIAQEHRVEDTITVMAMNKLIEGRSRSMYIFSRDGEKPISPNTVASYLKETGFPCSPHMFRKIWAAKIFNEVAFSGLKSKMTEKQAKDKFLKAVEAVAKKLGQTEKNTSIKSYIDPLLMKKFWDTVGFIPPATVQKAIEQMDKQDPNAED